MDISEARKRLPALADLDDQNFIEAVQELYYPDTSVETLASELGVKPKAATISSRSFVDTAKDVGISALKGAIAVPEAAVGLASLVTGGHAGKLAEEAGFRPKEAKAMLDEQYSDPQKAAFKEVQTAEGLGNTFMAAVRNPSVIGQTVVESLPSMAAGGVLARGGLALAPKMGGVVASAFGEGMIGAGSAAEQIRQQTTDGLLTGKQAGLAAATGAATAGFTMLGGKIAKKLGIADIDTMLAGAAANPAVRKGVVRSALEGAVSEGLLEELPQSVSEQVLQNIALDKPIDEGVNQAAVLGLLSGSSMGAGANVLNSFRTPPPKPTPKDILAAPDVDSAITAAQDSLITPQNLRTPAVNIAPNAINSVAPSITGTTPEQLLSTPDNPFMQAALTGRDDRQQDAMGDATVGDMRAEMDDIYKDQRQYGSDASAETAQLPSDMARPGGQPFTSANMARIVASRVPGAEVVAVPGGFVARRPQEANDVSPSTGVSPLPAAAAGGGPLDPAPGLAAGEGGRPAGRASGAGDLPAAAVADAVPLATGSLPPVAKPNFMAAARAKRASQLQETNANVPQPANPAQTQSPAPGAQTAPPAEVAQPFQPEQSYAAQKEGQETQPATTGTAPKAAGPLGADPSTAAPGGRGAVVEAAGVAPVKEQNQPVAQSQPAQPATDLVATPASGQPAPATTKNAKPKGLKQIAAQRIAQRADYFTPGNIVKSYGGHDEVVSYTPPNESGSGWSVKVRAVVQKDGQWVPDPKDNRERVHSSQPEAKEVAKGPVRRAEPQKTEANQASAQQASAPYAIEKVASTVGDIKTADQQIGKFSIGQEVHATGGMYLGNDGVVEKIYPSGKVVMAKYRDGEVAHRFQIDAAELADGPMPTPVAATKSKQPNGSNRTKSAALFERTARPDPLAERKDIAKASEAAADTFELGGNAEQNLSGQGGMFDEPAAPAKLATKQPSAAELRAKADLNNALADLGDIFSKPFKANITPEQEQKLLPVLTRVLDAAFRLGYAKFKDAAKFSLDQIKGALGADVADALTLDQLQGAYIAMAGGKPGTDTKRAVIDVENKSDIESHTAKTDNQLNEESNVPSPNAGLERNSQGTAAEPAVGDAVPADTGATVGAAGQDGGPASRGAGRGQQDGAGVPPGSTTSDRERSDQLVRGGRESPGPASSDARTDFGERSGDSGITGIPPDAISATEVRDAAAKGNDELRNRAKQSAASKLEVKPGDLQNVRDTLPYLLPAQQEDVHKAETIFAKPTGYGMLFTNGTGTGKTFTGLGVVKRFAMQGKNNTLIVVPDNKIASDWIKSGKALGLSITQLEDTTQAGKGIVLATYANLGVNDALARRQWDLIVPDESHTLMQNEDGKVTGALDNLRAISHHPDGLNQRFSMLFRKALDSEKGLSDWITAAERPPRDDSPAGKLGIKEAKEQLASLSRQISGFRQSEAAAIQAMQGAKRTRMVFLSATPFAYEKTVDWANGYLFDYMDGYPYDLKNAGLSYNQPNPFQHFMMTRFGYSMRVNKLNAPGPKVDSGLMQRQFNGELKKKGVLSGRMLDVKPDYDRRFVLIDSAIGNKIDEALEWLGDKAQEESEAQEKIERSKREIGMSELASVIKDQFDYLSRRYLLEGIKAEAVIPIVKQHLALGRKVVVFHDYNKGGSTNPFAVPQRTASTDNTNEGRAKATSFNKALAQFNAEFPQLATGLNDLLSPIELFKRELPQTMLINGLEKQKDLLARYLSFQEDATGPQVMLVQSDKNKGWSGHDTTGKHQRVLINLGQPTAPTKAIQQEGRIYRTGQASDAIMRYLNTGTSWERWAFATTIATRSSTAENLGMGEQARALKDSFIAAFEESDTFAPGHEGEGTGGKARDKANNAAITEYDRAKSFYYGTAKKNSKTKAQEGVDYFATPEPVGLKMVEWLDARSGEDLLEPSGGHGAIARWMPEKAQKTVIEPSANLRSRMALVLDMESTKMLDGTFEELNVVNKFDGIAMNPPFGSGGKTAIDHLAKAATHLRDGGRIVALIPTGPAADKKFEKWFYEESERPSKSLQTKTGMQKVYEGDTIVFEGKRFTAKSTGRVPGSFASSDYVTDGVTRAYHGSYFVEPGPRTESYRAAEDLYMVADIKLPQATFERAGTAVATRIVVIEKHAKESDAPRSTARKMDLSSIDDINDLFDRLENIDLPARTNPREVEDAPTSKAAKRTPEPAAAPTAPAANGDTVTLDGKPYTVTTYTTNAGKELLGVWVPTKAIALTFGPSTFEKKGQGFFVRQRDFPKDGPDKGMAMFSRPTNSPGPEQNALQALSQTDVSDPQTGVSTALLHLGQDDSLYQLPRSSAKDMQAIAADKGVQFNIEAESVTQPDGTERPNGTFNLTMPSGAKASITVNGSDVYINVAGLKEGDRGNAVYDVAANYAVNNDLVFKGDPSGLSDAAMRRRLENMLSSAIKYGTTDHLRPHPRQLQGDASIGVPALKWTPGDTLGNIRAMVDVSIEANDYSNPFGATLEYDPSSQRFKDPADGRNLEDQEVRAFSEIDERHAGAGTAGRTTLQRTALFKSLVQSEGARRAFLESIRRQRSQRGTGVGTAGSALEGAFYSRSTDPVVASQSTQAVEKIVQRITERWKNAPEVVIAYDMTDPRIPVEARTKDLEQRSGGAQGEPEGFFFEGKVYILASQVSSPKDVIRVLLHESLGHFGLRGVFGQGLTQVLNQVVLARRADVIAKAQQYGLGTTMVDVREQMVNESLKLQRERILQESAGKTSADLVKIVATAKAALDKNISDQEVIERMRSNLLQAAEEVLAEMAQTRPEMGFVKRAVAIIRAWLRSNVPVFKSMALTDADITANYILPARGFVERGQQADMRGAVPAFIRGKNEAVTNPKDVVGNQGGRVDDIYGDQIKVNGQWFHAERIFGRPAASFNVGEMLPQLARTSPEEKGATELADEVVTSNLFRESGANVSHTPETIAKYAKAMKKYGGWGKFPPIYGRVETVTSDDVERYAEWDKAGYAHELVYSRPLTIKDIGKRIVQIENGHNRAYAAAELGINIPVVDGNVEESKSSNPTAPDSGGAPMLSRSSKAIADTAPNDPRAYWQIAKDAVAELSDTPGKISWWHKTVGTPYSLAQKSPQFKAVFDRVQDFINDVSVFATQAADQAPTLLPKLESWRDMTKTAISAEDTKAIAAPVFEGTLVWARDENGKPIKMADKVAAADKLTAQQKAQEMLRAGLIQERVLKMWQGQSIEQYEAAVNTSYAAKVLKEGVVWSDAELKSMFNLTGEKQADGKMNGQIGLYKEFRSATDTSLTHLAVTDMLRFAGKDSDAVRADVIAMGDVDAAAVLLRDHLLEMAEQDPDRNDLLINTANQIMDKADRARDLMDRGYAPLSRFGQYTVDVVSPTGERLYFSMFEGRLEAARIAQQMQRTYPDATISRGTVSQEEYKLFSGVSPETLELFGGMLGLEGDSGSAKDQAFQAYIKLAKSNRSSMKRLIERKGIAGFSEDAGRVLAGFVYSNARQSSRNLHMGEIDEKANEVDKGQGELKDMAVRLADYIKNPVEEAQALRGMLFTQYLGGSIASAMVNMTQPFAVTMPYLSQWGGAAKAGKRMAQAARDAVKDKTGDTRLDAAMKKAADEGIVAPQEVHQLMAQAAGKGSLKSGDGTRMGDAGAAVNNALTKLALVWGKPFSTAELFNRRTTFIAAYRTAVDEGIADPAEFAKQAINETQFVYNKGNRPAWARGAIGATVFTFKTYSISYLELMHRLATTGEPGSPERAAGRRAVLFAMGMVLLLSGAGGLPFADDAGDVVDGIAQRLGYNWNTGEKRKQLLEDAFGKAFGGFLNKGVTGLPGAPIDVAGRLGLQNLIPGTGLFQKKTDFSRDPAELLGPVADLVTRGLKGADMITQGRMIDGVMMTAPVAARNMQKALDMATSGKYKDERGYKVMDVDGYDALAKGIGFQPGDVAKVQASDRAVQSMVALTRLRESEISAEWAKAVAERDAAGQQKARAKVQDWNEKNPMSPIKIRMGDILKRAKNMNMDRSERIAKTAPKEVRQEVRRQLQASE